jgi:hypothetical protein
VYLLCSWLNCKSRQDPLCKCFSINFTCIRYTQAKHCVEHLFPSSRSSVVFLATLFMLK